MSANRALVPVGRIAGAYGIKGWVRVNSFTDPQENVFAYAPWTLRDKTGRRPDASFKVLESRAQGKGWVAKLAGVQDRNAAEAMQGLEIVIDRSQMPEPGEDQFYWADLEGLRVRNRDGQALGRLDHLLETGSADVMVIVNEADGARHLIPFVMNETVVQVDLDAGCIEVDWIDPE